MRGEDRLTDDEREALNIAVDKAAGEGARWVTTLASQFRQRGLEEAARIALDFAALLPATCAEEYERGYTDGVDQERARLAKEVESLSGDREVVAYMTGYVKGYRLTADEADCQTCSWPSRETVGMVCQGCGTDYSGGAATPLDTAGDPS